MEAAVEEEAIKTIKEEATQDEDATNIRNSSEAAEGEAKEGEDTEATPPQAPWCPWRGHGGASSQGP